MKSFARWLEARAQRGIRVSSEESPTGSQNPEIAAILRGEPYTSRSKTRGISTFVLRPEDDPDDPARLNWPKQYVLPKGYILDLDIPDEKIDRIYHFDRERHGKPDVSQGGALGVDEMRPEYIKGIRRVRRNPEYIGPKRDPERFRKTFIRLFGKPPKE